LHNPLAMAAAAGKAKSRIANGTKTRSGQIRERLLD
jgi:hypothetical protein